MNSNYDLINNSQATQLNNWSVKHMIDRKLDIKTNYKVETLVAALLKNLETHKEDYKKAKEVYNKDVCDILSKVSKEASKISKSTDDIVDYSSVNNVYNKLYHLQKPVDATKKYDEYITLFNQSSEDKVELTLNDANAIINDSWDWAIESKTINAAYSSRY